MGPRQRLGVVDFAVRRRMSVEARPVPGGNAGFVIVGLFARIVPGAADLIGAADLVDAGIGRNTDFALRRRGAPAANAPSAITTQICRSDRFIEQNQVLERTRMVNDGASRLNRRRPVKPCL